MIRMFAILIFALAAGAVRAAPAPVWAVDKTASSIRFVSSYEGEAFSGGFSRWDADIRFDPAHLSGSSVSASIDVASAATGNADRDQALPTDTFFDTGKFPRATFTAHAFKALGDGRYEAIGTLTLRGVAKPLTLPFTLAIKGDEARMAATVSLDRLAFGIGQNEWRSTASVPAAVKVVISLTARRR